MGLLERKKDFSSHPGQLSFQPIMARRLSLERVMFFFGTFSPFPSSLSAFSPFFSW